MEASTPAEWRDEFSSVVNRPLDHCLPGSNAWNKIEEAISESGSLSHWYLELRRNGRHLTTVTQAVDEGLNAYTGFLRFRRAIKGLISIDMVQLSDKFGE